MVDDYIVVVVCINIVVICGDCIGVGYDGVVFE